MLWIVKNAEFVVTSKLCKRRIGNVTWDFTLTRENHGLLTLTSTRNFIKRCVNYIIWNFL